MGLRKKTKEEEEDKKQGKQPDLRDQQQDTEPAQGGPKSQFTEALKYFAPGILGGLVSQAQGGDPGLAFAEGFDRAHTVNRQFLKDTGGDNSVERDRLKVSQSNLEVRQQELKQQKARTANLEKDRDERMEEREIDRAIKGKENFASRPQVKKIKERLALLDEMDTIINEAPEIAAGTIGFKIAKGIAGEVGNLTENERKDAQISPSFIRNVKRYKEKFLEGKLPEEDVRELNKVINVLREKKRAKLEKRIKNYSGSFKKSLRNKDISNRFEDELRMEYGFQSSDEIQSEKREAARAKIEAMSPEEREQYKQQLLRQMGK